MLLAGAAQAAEGNVPPPGEPHSLLADTPAQWSFLDAKLRDRKILLLVSSTRGSRELPTVELPLIQFAHERLGFDVLAIQSSPVDVWLAQEHLYQSRDLPEITLRNAQDMAWPPLEQNDAVLKLLGYVFHQGAVESPLYLAGFEPGLGTGRMFDGWVNALEALLTAVARHVGAPAPPASEWIANLKVLPRCVSNLPALSDSERQRADDSIRGVAGWIDQSSEAVARTRPDIHVQSLKRLSGYLREALTLCAPASDRSAVLGSLRAQNLSTLARELSPHHRVLALAYESSLPRWRDTALVLQGTAHADLFAIGILALRGRTLSPDPRFEPPFVARALVPADAQFDRCGTTNCFLDLAEGALSKPELLDGMIVLHQVSASDLLFLPEEDRRKGRLIGWALDHPALVLTVPAVLIGLALFTVRRRARRSRSAMA